MSFQSKRPLFDVQSSFSLPVASASSARYKLKEKLFLQGDAASSIFFLQAGRAKLTVVSPAGKEATISIVGAGDFIGAEVIFFPAARHDATAQAITACDTLAFRREAMIELLHTQKAFSDFFIERLIIKAERIQADLIDQLFNSSERRLARTLLLMADYSEDGPQLTRIPAVTQQTLADMVGTTRSRTSFFLNRFRRLGYITYEDGHRILVHKNLLNIVLPDQCAGEHAAAPGMIASARRPSAFSNIS